MSRRQEDSARHFESDEEAEAADLRNRLERLRRRREGLLDERLETGWEAGGIGAIGVPVDPIDAFDRDPEVPGDLADVEREIAEVQARLEALADDG